MIRRFALAACAVVAAAALSSCSTFSQNDAAAKVGQVEISESQVAEVVTWLTSNADTVTELQVFQAPSAGMANGDLARSAVELFVVNEAFRQTLTTVGAADAENQFVDASDQNVPEVYTGPARELLVQRGALQQAAQSLPADKQEQFLETILGLNIFVDARYGAWDSAAFALSPMG